MLMKVHIVNCTTVGVDTHSRSNMNLVWMEVRYNDFKVQSFQVFLHLLLVLVNDHSILKIKDTL